MDEDKSLRRFATVKEFAEILRLHPGKVYEMAGYRNFPKMKVGRKVLIEVEQAIQFIRENRV